MEQRGDDAAQAFNNYQKWFESLDRTDQSIDAMLGGVRIRCFGSEQAKQEAWDKEWRSKFPKWGPAAAGVSVSSEVPEIWCDLRQDASGQLILPMHVIGHEMLHTLKLKNDKVVNPDTLINNEIYLKK